jgi:hypothetical protein
LTVTSICLKMQDIISGSAKYSNIIHDQPSLSDVSTPPKGLLDQRAF